MCTLPLSFDAYIGGNRATPSDAYRFAKGETIDILERQVKIDRPLDFAAITDHAEFLGELYSIHTPEAPGHNAFIARYFRSVGLDTTKLWDQIRYGVTYKSTTPLTTQERAWSSPIWYVK